MNIGRSLRYKGTEIYEIDAGEKIRATFEDIRAQAAVMIGPAASPEEASEISQAVPKMAFVSKAQTYETVTGKIVKEDQIDLVARIMSMGTLHKAYAATGAVWTAGAARIEGTVVNDMVKGKKLNETIYLGHPGGIIDIGVKVEKKGNTFKYEEAIVGRTARRLMEGYVCVPERFFM